VICNNCSGIGAWCIGPWDGEQTMFCGACDGTGESLDSLDPSTPIEVIDERLRDAGADPEAIAAEGAALAAYLLADLNRRIDAKLGNAVPVDDHKADS
jgi:hypothetical protein